MTSFAIKVCTFAALPSSRVHRNECQSWAINSKSSILIANFTSFLWTHKTHFTSVVLTNKRSFSFCLKRVKSWRNSFDFLVPKKKIHNMSARKLILNLLISVFDIMISLPSCVRYVWKSIKAFLRRSRTTHSAVNASLHRETTRRKTAKLYLHPEVKR